MTRRALHEKTSAIPPVEDYYGGVAHTELVVPDHILVFARRTPRLLGTHRKVFDHHHRFVLIANLETPGLVGIDGHQVRLAEGQSVLVFPHQFHHYLNPEGETLNWLFVTFELSNPSSLASLKNIRIDLSPRALDLLEKLVDCTLEKDFKQKGVNNRLALRVALFLEELVALSRDAARKPARKRDVRATPTDVFIARMHDYLMNHLGENFKLKELAQTLRMSESHLRATFRRHFGVSIGHFIRESRIAKACGLIHNSDLNVSHVAEECGFDSLYSFSRAFKRAIGVSPRGYRQFVRGVHGKTAPAQKDD